MSTTARLRIAYTPDSDDAFNFYAWEHGKVTLPGSGPAPEFHREHIGVLNAAARAGDFDVVATSSVIYPELADRYWILAVGTSVGRGWGPVLVARDELSADDLRGKRVAVAGHPTTGSVLLQMYCPGVEMVTMAYDGIADAIAAGTLDAGVMIHEELLHFPAKGLRPVKDLGRAWFDDTGLPLPVGTNLVSRAVGLATARDIATTCQRSLRWAFDHADEAYRFASQFGRGQARKHVEMFSNQDTLALPDDVRRAMRVLFDRVAAMGLGPRLGAFEIIDGEIRP